MGAFITRCKIENPVQRSKSAIVTRMLVDTGSEYTWVQAAVLEKIGIRREDKYLSFVMANGQTITRDVGFAIIRLDKFFTIDEVVFAEKGDLSLLGARTLEGLNLTIDARRRKLIAAGPLPAAATRNRHNFRTSARK
ncbi:MAG: retroviral-like aspartic protease family protein [Deltaproteobacteria bacterium]|nr:retroviral-like aspartic protease family protein [Deltaproteobacteria bacterium]